MRNILVFMMFFAMFAKYSLCQNFISEDKKWSVVSRISNMDTYQELTTLYQFFGDSIIGSTVYKKLYKIKDNNEANREFHSLWYERNDSIFYNHLHTDHKDFLIYNFNITIGDTILNHFYEDDYGFMILDSTVNKQWGNNLKKHFYFHSPYFNNEITTWIEGVGQTGLFTRNTEAGITGAYVRLLCFEENGELVYQNLNYNSCYINTGLDFIEEKPQLIEILSFENETLRIKSNENYGEIIFYSLEGKQLLKQKISELETQICLPQSGIVLYQFTTDKGEVQTGKVMVM